MGAGGTGAPFFSPAFALLLAAAGLQQPPRSPAAPTGAAVTPADSWQEGSSPLGAAGGAPSPLRGAAVRGSKPGPSHSGLTVSVVAQPAEALAPIWGVARRLGDQRRPEPVGPREWGEERSFKRQSEGGGAPVHKRQQAGPAARRPSAAPSTKRRGATLAAAAGVAMAAAGAAAAAAGMRAVVAAKPPAAAAAARLSAPAAAGALGANNARPAQARASAPSRANVYPGALRRGAAGGGGGQAKELAKEGGQLPKRRLAMSRVESGGSGGSGR
jgi:hypothetical protein